MLTVLSHCTVSLSLSSLSDLGVALDRTNCCNIHHDTRSNANEMNNLASASAPCVTWSTVSFRALFSLLPLLLFLPPPPPPLCVPARLSA